MFIYHFYSLNGEALQVPQEWQPAWLLIEQLNPEKDNVDLRLQSQPLTLHKQQLNDQWQWLAAWQRCGAGHYVLSLNGETQHISILPNKISSAAFEQLLLDLQQHLAPAVALALQQCGALAGITIQPFSSNSLPEELNRLRRAINGDAKVMGLRQLLPQLARHPQHTLQTHTHWQKRELARRPLIQQWAQQLKVSNLDAQQRPLQVLNQNYAMTLDVAENRFVKFYLYLLQQRLRRLHGLATAQQAVWQEETGALERFIQHAQHSTFLRQVHLPQQMPSINSQILLKHPVYRAILENYLQFQHSLSANLDLQIPELDVPLENLPKLYQHWCCLQVMLCVLEMAATLNYRVCSQNLCRRSQTAWYVKILPHGQTLLELEQKNTGKRVCLIPERSYRSESVSFLQRPDLTLEMTQVDGTYTLYLFDAKYKLDSNAARPQKVDIDKMHAYRDAIRPQGKPAVRYAAILYPGELQNYDAGLQALPADPAHSERLREALLKVLQQGLA